MHMKLIEINSKMETSLTRVGSVASRNSIGIRTLVVEVEPEIHLVVGKLVRETGSAQSATTVTLHHDSSAEDVTPTRTGHREKRNSLKHAKGTGIAQFATTTTLHGEQNANDAMPTKMAHLELRVEMMVRGEVDGVVLLEVDVEAEELLEVDLEVHPEVDVEHHVEVVDSMQIDHSVDSSLNPKTRKSLSTIKFPSFTSQYNRVQ